jgi:SAM-dependent methyltransferase
MKRTNILKTFKFDANIKQPLVLRPVQAPLTYRLLLGTMKAVSKIPTKIFQSQLSLDSNERIVEVPFVLQNLVSPAGLRILDFGCTESVLPIYLATLGAQVIGVDLRDYDFEHPNFSFCKGNFLDNDFQAAYFDIVIAVSAVEHCGLNVYGSSIYDRGDFKVVQEFKRVLRPQGHLLLTVPFGNRYIDEELRIYDSELLKDLTNGFAVLKRKFYRKAVEGTYWLECSEEEAANARYHPVTGVEGVVLLLCENPDEAGKGQK